MGFLKEKDYLICVRERANDYHFYQDSDESKSSRMKQSKRT